MAAAVPEGVANSEHNPPGIVQDGRDEGAEKFTDATDEESGKPSPQPAPALQRWNESAVNMFRFFATIYCFILMGMTDGAVGVCLTRVLRDEAC